MCFRSTKGPLLCHPWVFAHAVHYGWSTPQPPNVNLTTSALLSAAQDYLLRDRFSPVLRAHQISQYVPLENSTLLPLLLRSLYYPVCLTTLLLLLEKESCCTAQANLELRILLHSALINRSTVTITFAIAIIIITTDIIIISSSSSSSSICHAHCGILTITLTNTYICIFEFTYPNTNKKREDRERNKGRRGKRRNHFIRLSETPSRNLFWNDWEVCSWLEVRLYS